MDKVKIWYPLRAAFHNHGLILGLLVGTGKPRSFSAALLALWTVGFAFRTALWKLPDAIRDLRIPPNHKLQPQRQSTGSANSNSTNHPSPPNTPLFQQAASLRKCVGTEVGPVGEICSSVWGVVMCIT
jgi:hypothetical protein